MHKLLPLIVGAALAAAGAAHAEDSGPSVAFNLGASTDYVFRGVSQTDEKAQVFGGADLTAGRFYAGTWLSNVDFNDGSTNVEYDLYAGFKPTLGPVALDLGVIRYGYTDQPSGADYDNWEVKVAGSIPAGKATLGAAVYYSPDSFGSAEQATYYEVNTSAPLNDKFSVSGALGRQTYEGTGDYTTWNVGVGWAITSKFGLDLRYWDTDEHGFGDIYKGRAVASLKATF
jgi:uncharacterized protein (TIGR02001 family)